MNSLAKPAAVVALLNAWSVRIIGAIRRRLSGQTRGESGQVDSILVIRLDELGDFTLFSSILRPLRAGYPSAWITLVVSDWIRPLAALCPYVDEVIAFPSRGPRLWQYLAGPWRALRVAQSLDRTYDLAINSRFDRDIRGAAFLAEFSMARCIVGYPSSTDTFKAALNYGYNCLYTHLLPVGSAVLHEVARSAAVLEFLRVPTPALKSEIWLSHEDRREAARLLRDRGCRLHTDALVCLGVGAGAAHRRWPVERFAELARHLTGKLGFKVLIVGDRSDRPIAEKLRAEFSDRVIDLTGIASLRVSAAAIAECQMFIGNDSGPKHIAAALGLSIIAINCHPKDGDPAHFQSPERFSPLSENVIVLAPEHAIAPCASTCLANTAHCIKEVSVEQVLEAVARLRIHTWAACR
jgi:ADP-heptose:LPS heptosyltransferase